jgi:hypothetical protein
LAGGRGDPAMRELINKYPLAAGAFVVVALAVAVVFVVRGSVGPTNTIAGGAYYTDDDGNSFFVDEAQKVTPFDHNGKQAVKAYVFSCDGKRSVHYMERLTDVGRKVAQDSLQKSGGQSIDIPDTFAPQAYEYKRPGETSWRYKLPGPLPCPDGKPAEFVTP